MAKLMMVPARVLFKAEDRDPRFFKKIMDSARICWAHHAFMIPNSRRTRTRLRKVCPDAGTFSPLANPHAIFGRTYAAKPPEGDWVWGSK